MKHLFSTLTLIFAAAITSFACVGEFTYTVTGNTVTFHGNSDTPEVTYHWNFGDQHDANGQNVTHTYTLYPEHYNVCLTISDGQGCTDDYCVNIFVQTGPTCEAFFETEAVCLGTTTHFTDGSATNVGTVNSWLWSFGDGVHSELQNPEHTYAISGAYEVCLTIETSEGCTDEYCRNVVALPLPNTLFIAQNNVVGETVHVNNETTISNGSIASYTWHWGDGSTTSNVSDPTHVYSEPGTYNICLVAVSNEGCVDEYCHEIVIEPVPSECQASFTYAVNNNTVTFESGNTQPNEYYHWIFGDGTDANGTNVSHTYTVFPEHYNVCAILINTITGCRDTVCQTIFIEGSGSSGTCEAFFEYDIDNNLVHFFGVSSADGSTYHWSFGDDEHSGQQNPNHDYALFPEHYSVCLTIVTPDGCTDTYCETVFVEGGSTGSNCEASIEYVMDGNNVHFFGHSTEDNVDYIWNFGDGHNGTGQDPWHTYTQFPEHYEVCLIIGNNNIGCRDTVCETIYVHEGVQCSADFTYTITGNEVHFAAPSNTDGTHYLWSFGDGSHADGHHPNHAYELFPEHYEVCLTVTNSATGCSETHCETIFIEAQNTQHFAIEGTIYAGQHYADEGHVYLIHYNADLGLLEEVATAPIGTNGHYVFTNVAAGNYFLKAALGEGSLYYEHWLPTYFEHELFWYQANVVSVTANLNRNIHLIEGNNPGGPGFVGGLVSEGANKTSGPGDPVEGVQIMLLTMNDEPVQYVYTNAAGEFSFEGVAYGTYKVYGEVLNLNTIPAIVTISAPEPSVDNIGLLVTSSEVTTGVYEPAVINESAVGELFPNPTNGDAAVNISLSNDARVAIRLFDIAGRQVYANILNLGAGIQQINLPVSALNAGIYSLSLSDEKSNTMVTRKLVKTE
ncbi:MAG: PKD domain-containing protein [Bacteroidia bacterium]